MNLSNATLEGGEAKAPRVFSVCPHFGRCGNCSLQELSLQEYRRLKLRMVKEAFSTWGLRPLVWKEPVFVGTEKRRRVTFSIVLNRGKVSMGYYKRLSQQIIDIKSCIVAEPRLVQLKTQIQPRVRNALYENKTVHFSIQNISGAIDVLMTGSIKRPPLQALDEIMEISRLSVREHEKARIETLFARTPIIATFGNLSVSLVPGAFTQATFEGERALSESVVEALPRGGRYADLFAGFGTFSGKMLEYGDVDSYELDPSAVSALARAGRSHPIRAFRRDLFRRPLSRQELNRYDAVVFDAPRSGCERQAMNLSQAKTGVIIGVSCNPHTFARDARILCDGGYWLHSLQVVDQFMFSNHMEVVGVFTRAK